MKPTIAFALFLILQLTATGSFADTPASRPMPAWWEHQVRVAEAEGGYSLYRVEDGALIAEGVSRLDPEGRFVIPSRGDKRGVIDPQGRLLLPIDYQEIEPRDEIGAFKVKREGRWGLVGYDGEIRLPAQFDYLEDGPRETAGAPWVVGDGTRRGLLDPASGQLLLPLEYSEVQVKPPFVTAAVTQGQGDQAIQRWSVFDLRGVPVPGVDADTFHGTWERAGLVLAGGFRALDSMGREVIPAGLYERIIPAGGRAIAIRNGLRGLINSQGEPLTPFRYTEMWPLGGDAQEGLFGVREADAETGLPRTGVVDRQGQRVVEPRWDRVEYLSAMRDGQQTHYYLVARDGRTGSLDAQGRPLVPAQFDAASRLDSDDSLFLVTREGLSGLCDLSRGDCPVPLVYSRLTPSDLSPDDDLYLAESEGRVGLVSERNEIVVPLRFEWIRGLPRTALGSVEVEASLAFVVTRFRLERDEQRHWSASILPGSPIGEQPFDRHPLAMELKPVVEARYLPDGMVSDANVLAAAQAGRLNEAVYPSIQLAGRTAYVNFNRFVREGREPLAETMTVCREADGFRLLISVAPGQADTGVCDEAGLDSLRWVRDGKGDLTCEACAELGLPERWVPMEASVSQSCDSAESGLAAWSSESARQEYREWLYRWYGDLPVLLAVRDEADSGRSAADDDRLRSVRAHSRAHRALAALILDPRRLAGPLAGPASDLDWSGLIRRFSDLLGAAEPIGEGGIYPETDPRYTGSCAEVWYLRLPMLEAAHADGLEVPGLEVYALPPAGEFRRNAYPFLTFQRTSAGIRLEGVSREFLQALLWQEARR